MTLDERLDYISRLCSFERHESLAQQRLSASDADELVIEIERQFLPGWCWANIRKFYSQDANVQVLSARLRKSALFVAARNENNRMVLESIEQLFANEGIETISLKGIAMMQCYYDDITQRSIGDIDLLIAEKDLLRSREILLANGGINTQPTITADLEQVRTHLGIIHYRGQSIELHRNIYRKHDSLNPLVSVFDYIEKRNGHLVFNPVMMAYNLMTHAYSNLCICGIRYNWIVDVALLFEQSTSVADYVESIIALNPNNRKKILYIASLAMPLLTPAKRDELSAKLSLRSRCYNSKVEGGKYLRYRWLNIVDKISLLFKYASEHEDGFFAGMKALISQHAKNEMVNKDENGLKVYIHHFFGNKKNKDKK